jgi:hypothetical protein
VVFLLGYGLGEYLGGGKAPYSLSLLLLGFGV